MHHCGRQNQIWIALEAGELFNQARGAAARTI
jgi:hypothetical protein